jgi:hypothetical protein
MVRILILLLGALSQRREARYQMAMASTAGTGWAGTPGPRRPAGSSYRLHGTPDPPTQVLPPVPAEPQPLAPAPGPPPGPGRRRWIPRWLKWGAILVLAGLVFRRAVAAAVMAALSASLHFVGLNVHLPHISFGWPWQSAGSSRASTNVAVGPWVLQKIEGISKPALGTETFNFVFTHKVSKNIGPWPCWYSSTFYAVGHASATVNLNPGPSWWTPATGHYQLRVLSPPAAGQPGRVNVTMVLPPPQLPQNVHDVTIDNTLSKPLSSDHSWTYPGLGCGALIRPQFTTAVVYAQAQQQAFYRVNHVSTVTRPLISTAESQAAQIIRNNFVQPTVNALGYELSGFTLRWAAGLEG